MIFPALINEAWQALHANRLRTLLTMLGMIFGVGAVIMMLAIGRGAQLTVNQAIHSMGSHLFIVLSGSTTAGGIRQGAGSVPTLTFADAQAIAELPSISATAPSFPNTAQIVYSANNWSTQVIGTTPDFFAIRNWSVSVGELFTANDVRSAVRVVLIGQTTAQKLFAYANPVGKTVRIKNSPFLVLGLLETKGQNLDGRDQDDVMYLPITTAQRQLFGNPFPGMIRYITVKAKSAELMNSAEQEITDLLRTRHKIRDGQDNDFTVRNLTATAMTTAKTTHAMSTMLGAIASVSLLVGGIGIMNIMLVSVTERTREIGIRMACGAKQADILWQFLIEALLISLIGSVLGVLLGMTGAYFFSQFNDSIVLITLDSLLLAFGTAMIIGVFFGFYPAQQAARLKPIEALRYY